jgi:hypothetical protein
MITLNRLCEPPVAITREMRAYLAAILEVTGMMSGQGFPLSLFMENFRTHLRPKVRFPHATLEKHTDGLFYVTAEGWRFFSSRLTELPAIAGQTVSRPEVLEVARKILAVRPEVGWESFSVSLQVQTRRSS